MSGNIPCYTTHLLIILRFLVPALAEPNAGTISTFAVRRTLWRQENTPGLKLAPGASLQLVHEIEKQLASYQTQEHFVVEYQGMLDEFAVEIHLLLFGFFFSISSESSHFFSQQVQLIGSHFTWTMIIHQLNSNVLMEFLTHPPFRVHR